METRALDEILREWRAAERELEAAPDDDEREDQQRQEQSPARGFLDREPGDDKEWRQCHFSSSSNNCRKRSSNVWWRGATSYTRPPMATICATRSGTRSGSRLANVS